ncbi:hypothetical protein F4775DRAFT_558206 [Biscogniauxia sp. FL1348]|nr:hypothetical protein F4775DRAFT_558206 [Biscogniauxia sp. FL1348]
MLPTSCLLDCLLITFETRRTVSLQPVCQSLLTPLSSTYIPFLYVVSPVPIACHPLGPKVLHMYAVCVGEPYGYYYFTSIHTPGLDTAAWNRSDYPLNNNGPYIISYIFLPSRTCSALP